MAYTTINKPSLYFNTVLYTGNDSTQNITGVGFQPDLWWNKSRSGTHSAGVHCWYDSVRGTTKRIKSNSTDAEATISGVTAFNTDGVSLGSENQSNGGSTEYAAWNWLAANSTTSNTSGTITSTVSANQTAGFSIVSYTGNGTGNSTVGHGLGAVPKFMIVKKRDGVEGWGTLTASFVSAADPNIVYLNNALAQADDTNVWGTSANFTSSTFTVGTWNGSNANASTYICYCWSEIKGYSKFGKYTGNGADDGTFVYTGFKPAWLMVRRTDSGDGWLLFDNKRNTFNPEDKFLQANLANAESTFSYCDFTSNGFKARTSAASFNASGGTYIYAAFAENPFVSSTLIPTTAR